MYNLTAMGSGRYTAEFYTDNDTKYLSFAILGYNITSAFTISKIRVAYGLGKYSFIDKFTLANNTTDGATISTTETPVVGAVNGYANYGCKNYGAGGIVGYVGDNVRIEYCTTRNSTVTGTAFVGGLAGQNLSKNGYTSSSANTGISDVYNCNVRNSNINSTGKVASAIKGVRPYGGFIGDSYQYTTPMQVSDTDLQNSSYTGGLIGYKYGGSVYGCEVTGSTITAKASIVGGIIGYSLMTQSVAMCKNTSDIEISESVITGYTSESDGEYVLGKFKYVGGIVGIVADYKPYRSVRYSGFTGCVNYGSITDNMSTSVSAYLTCVGGVAGAMYGGGDNKRSEYKGSTSASTYYNIKHKIICYSANHGNITLKHHYYNSTNGDPEYIGGVIGRANTDSTGIEITYCYNTGVISASTGSYIGGLIGSYWRMYSTISYCFNVGRVVGSSTYKALIGQIGFTSNNTYTKNFYQEGVSNGNKDDTSVATEKTMNEMSSTSTLSTLGYSTTYMANSTTAGYYPCLNSNYAKGDTHIEATTSDAFDIAGDGYIIETAKHLEILADKVNNNRSGSLGQYSKQTYYVVANINCGNNYIPIGSSENTPFMGTFKGVASRTSLTTVQTRTIAMYGYSSSYSGGAYGLFGYTNGANISHITRGADLYTNSGTSGKNYVGGIVGKAVSSQITNCANSANIVGANHIAGIAGYAFDSKISNCENNGTITGTGERVGGIAGEVYNMRTDGVLSCKNRGAVSGGLITGGIAGVSFNSTIKSCINYANVSISTSASNVGGIVGYGSDNTSIYSCSTDNTSSPKVTGGANVGGIAGYLNSSEILYSRNKIGVSGYAGVGGIVGQATSANGEFSVAGASSNAGEVRCLGKNTNLITKTRSITYTYTGWPTLTQCNKLTSAYMAGIGGIVGICNTSITGVTNSGNVLIALSDAGDLSVTHSKTGLFNLGTWTSDVAGALGGFGGLVGFFSGNSNSISYSGLSGSFSIGTDSVSSTKGIVCAGGLVGYMENSTYMKANNSTDMGSVSLRGAYFIGAVVGYSAATAAETVTLNVAYYENNVKTDVPASLENIYPTTFTYQLPNVQALYNNAISFAIDNPTYNGGKGYDNDSDWKDFGGGLNSSKVTLNGFLIGCMVSTSRYMVSYKSYANVSGPTVGPPQQPVNNGLFIFGDPEYGVNLFVDIRNNVGELFTGASKNFVGLAVNTKALYYIDGDEVCCIVFD